jgi:hypothetical protein
MLSWHSDGSYQCPHAVAAARARFTGTNRGSGDGGRRCRTQAYGQVLLASEGDPAAGGVLVMIDEDWIERQLTMAPELSRARRKNLSRLLATVERSTQGETSSVPSLVLLEPSPLQEPQTEWRAAG